MLNSIDKTRAVQGFVSPSKTVYLPSMKGEPGSAGEVTRAEMTAYVKQQVSSLYINAGTIQPSDIGQHLLTEEYRNYVWSVTQDFTTTDLFKEGAGIEVAAGTNIAAVEIDGQFKFDILGSIFDMSKYYDKEQAKAKFLEKVDGTTHASTVYGVGWDGRNHMRKVGESIGNSTNGALAMYITPTLDKGAIPDGAIWTATPQFDGQAANKKYVDAGGNGNIESTATPFLISKVDVDGVRRATLVLGEEDDDGLAFYKAGLQAERVGIQAYEISESGDKVTKAGVSVRNDGKVRVRGALSATDGAFAAGAVPIYYGADELPEYIDTIYQPGAHLFTNEPTLVYHAANKGYVDTIVNEVASTKLDKIPTDGSVKIYCQVGNNQTQRYLATTNNLMANGWIPMYWNKTDTFEGQTIPGVLVSGEPQSEKHVATKKYVDTNTASTAKLSSTSSDMNRVFGMKNDGSIYNWYIGGVQGQQFSRNSFATYWTSNEVPSNTSSLASARLFTGTPNHPKHATNKEYVDNAVANAGGGTKLYKHTVTIKDSFMGVNEDTLIFVAINNQSSFNLMADVDMAFMPQASIMANGHSLMPIAFTYSLDSVNWFVTFYSGGSLSQYQVLPDRVTVETVEL